jgi:hypothetical protein
MASVDGEQAASDPRDVREQYEKQLKDQQKAHGEALLALRVGKNFSPYWARIRNDRLDPSATQSHRIAVSISQMCRW